MGWGVVLDIGALLQPRPEDLVHPMLNKILNL